MNLVSRAVFGVSLFLAFSTAPLFGDWSETANIRPSWSGTWYDADQPGHGISVEVLDDERTIFYWYGRQPVLAACSRCERAVFV